MEAVRYTVEYTHPLSIMTVQEIAALNVEILRQTLVDGQSFFNHNVNFTVHKNTGFVRQIPNAHGWIFTDSDDVKCSVVIASDTLNPIIVCDTSPVDSHVMDVLCTMDMFIQTSSS